MSINVDAMRELGNGPDCKTAARADHGASDKDYRAHEVHTNTEAQNTVTKVPRQSSSAAILQRKAAEHQTGVAANDDGAAGL